MINGHCHYKQLDGKCSLLFLQIDSVKKFKLKNVPVLFFHLCKRIKKEEKGKEEKEEEKERCVVMYR